MKFLSYVYPSCPHYHTYRTRALFHRVAYCRIHLHDKCLSSLSIGLGRQCCPLEATRPETHTSMHTAAAAPSTGARGEEFGWIGEARLVSTFALAARVDKHGGTTDEVLTRPHRPTHALAAAYVSPRGASPRPGHAEGSTPLTCHREGLLRAFCGGVPRMPRLSVL